MGFTRTPAFNDDEDKPFHWIQKKRPDTTTILRPQKNWPAYTAPFKNAKNVVLCYDPRSETPFSETMDFAQIMLPDVEVLTMRTYLPRGPQARG